MYSQQLYRCQQFSRFEYTQQKRKWANNSAESKAKRQEKSVEKSKVEVEVDEEEEDVAIPSRVGTRANGFSNDPINLKQKS